MLKQCKHCHQKFKPANTAHHCVVLSRVVDHEDGEHDFIDTMIAVAAAEVIADVGSSLGDDDPSPSDPGTDFGGDGGSFGGGGADSEW